MKERSEIEHSVDIEMYCKKICKEISVYIMKGLDELKKDRRATGTGGLDLEKTAEV